MKRLTILALAGAFACGGGEPAADTSTGTPETPEMTVTFDAEVAFNTVCATCHGTTGVGDGPAGMALDPRPASFSDPEFWETRDDEHLFTVIKEGGAAVGRSPLMVGWGASFDDDRIRQLVDYVKTFKPE